MRRKIFLFICLFVISTLCFPQQKEIDSLRVAVKTAKHDTIVCDIYLHWGELIYAASPDSAILLWKKAENISEKNISANKDNKKFYLLRLANALSNIGAIYHYQGKISDALEYLYKALKVCEELNDKTAIPITLNNIGSIYFDQENYQKAMECYEKSLKIHLEMNDKRGIGNAYNNIASIYDHQKNEKMALQYLLAGLKSYEAIGDKRGIGKSLHNIAGIYKDQKKYSEALECYNKSLKIRKKMSDKEGVAAVLNNIADIKLKTGETNEAFAYATKGMLTAKDIGYPGMIGNSAGILKRIFQKQNKYKEAFEMYELEMTMKDSLRNQETQKSTLKKELQYDYEKKEAVAEAEHKSELKNQEIIATEKNRKQKIVIAFVIFGLIVALLFTGFVFRSLKITRKQKALIEKQKLFVEQHQKEIIDSIRYARRIQQSLLPTEKYIEKNLKRLQKKD